MEVQFKASLNEDSAVPLYEQLADHFRGLISTGCLLSGERIPSVRELSSLHSISLSTVRRALQELLEEGWLTVRPGIGAYVSDQAVTQAGWLRSNQPVDGDATTIRTDLLHQLEEDVTEGALSPGALGKHINSCFDKAWLFARYDEQVDIDFRVGAPPFDSLTGTRWYASLSEWTKELSRDPKGHNDSSGLPELREHMAAWLRSSRGLVCSADDVFIVSGAQQARNLAARLLINRGTKLGFEEPGGIYARLMFESFGAHLIPISVDTSGIMIDELMNIHDVPLLYVTPSAQFPTGAVLAQSRRQKIAAWAKKNNAIVIEDDNHCEFVYDSRLAPAIQSYDDACDRTIYIGTLSQMIMPGWRIGYMVVPRALREPLYRLKWLTDRNTSSIVQKLVLILFEGGFFPLHLKRAQNLCDTRRKWLLDILSDWPSNVIRYTPTKGGLHQAVWLPASVDDIEVFDRCFAHGVGVLPLSPCYLGDRALPGLMLNFSALEQEQMIKGLDIVKRIVTRLHGT